ncbi:hypothetical protein Golax_010352 [Gossypium laxum]|uniref:DUF4283 domain-containing protein n=2 Tax=Gossypium TaxID=3633 RepID=A0A7J8ZH65_9ROSI|nr:hypothetical protein [Gossypium laxum]
MDETTMSMIDTLMSFKEKLIGNSLGQRNTHNDVYEIMRKMMLHCLMRIIGFNALQNCICTLWKPTQPMKVMDIENDHFLVKFHVKENYLKVIDKGQSIVFGYYLMVEPPQSIQVAA